MNSSERVVSLFRVGSNKLPPRQIIGSSYNHPRQRTPSGDEWLHALKFDGYRMLFRIDRGRVTVWSRNGKDWTEKFQNVVEPVKSLKATNEASCNPSALTLTEITYNFSGDSQFTLCVRYIIQAATLRHSKVSQVVIAVLDPTVDPRRDMHR